MAIGFLGEDKMSNYERAVGAALGLLLLSACTPGGFGVGDGYHLARQTEPKGSAFNRHLYDNYMVLATAERREFDWRDSAHFADKALSAARDEQVDPEPVRARRFDPIGAAELSRARKHLTAALEKGARSEAPAEAAHALSSFDCWVQEKTENQQLDDTHACRNDFYVALSQVQHKLGLAVALGPTAGPESDYLVYFGFNSDKLSEDAVATVKAAAADLVAGDAKKVLIGGHADRAGPDLYNEDLSQRRVQVVKELLLSAGVKAQQIKIARYGEKLPRVATPDNTAASENRRVEINLVE